MRDYEVLWIDEAAFTFHLCEDILVAIARAYKRRPNVEIFSVVMKRY